MGNGNQISSGFNNYKFKLFIFLIGKCISKYVCGPRRPSLRSEIMSLFLDFIHTFMEFDQAERIPKNRTLNSSREIFPSLSVSTSRIISFRSSSVSSSPKFIITCLKQNQDHLKENKKQEARK